MTIVMLYSIFYIIIIKNMINALFLLQQLHSMWYVNTLKINLHMCRNRLE